MQLRKGWALEARSRQRYTVQAPVTAEGRPHEVQRATRRSCDGTADDGREGRQHGESAWCGSLA